MYSTLRELNQTANHTGRAESADSYWDEDWEEQEWRREIGSGRKPNLDEYDKQDR